MLGQSTVWEERRTLGEEECVFQEGILSFSISCLNFHYCMSPKPREHCTCMKIMNHIPCLFENIITLWKKNKNKNPEHYPKALWISQYSWRKDTACMKLCFTFGQLCSLSVVHLVLLQVEKKRNRLRQAQCEEHCINEIPLKLPCP